MFLRATFFNAVVFLGRGQTQLGCAEVHTFVKNVHTAKGAMLYAVVFFGPMGRGIWAVQRCFLGGGPCRNVFTCDIF